MIGDVVLEAQGLDLLHQVAVVLRVDHVGVGVLAAQVAVEDFLVLLRLLVLQVVDGVEHPVNPLVEEPEPELDQGVGRLEDVPEFRPLAPPGTTHPCGMTKMLLLFPSRSRHSIASSLWTTMFLMAAVQTDLSRCSYTLWGPRRTGTAPAPGGAGGRTSPSGRCRTRAGRSRSPACTRQSP
jgi:hypothetical protein